MELTKPVIVIIVSNILQMLSSKFLFSRLNFQITDRLGTV